MPVKSEKQRRFMYASLAGKTDVPPSIAKKFVGPKAHNDGGAVKEPGMKKSLPDFMMKSKSPAKKMPGKKMAEMKSAKKPVKKMMGGGSCK
jgi:hypothetical protein